MTNKHKCDLGKCFITVAGGRLVKVCCKKNANTAVVQVLGYQPKRAAYRLGSAEAMARKHPRTFQIPDPIQRSSLPKGAFAKLMFRKGKMTERMWVKVTSVTGTGAKTRYKGKLDNAPATVDLKAGATIEFAPRHIIDITTAKGYAKLSPRQKRCVQLFMPEEMEAFKAGRFSSRKQAAAVAYSRARREC